VARMGRGKNVYRVLVGKPEGKSPLWRPRPRCENGIKMDLKAIGWGGGSGITWRAVVNAVMKLRVLAPRNYLVLESSIHVCTHLHTLNVEVKRKWSFFSIAPYIFIQSCLSVAETFISCTFLEKRFKPY
jgi:hypothetical protein